MSVVDPLSSLSEWAVSNFTSILFSVIIVLAGYVVFKFLSGQITRLRERGSLERHFSYTLNRIIKWATVLLVLSGVLGLFGVTFAVISGLLALIGGTIIGFASINTLGNALAGLIVMISKPFGVGDRVLFKSQLADIEDIELIYTKMRTLDNVLVSIPNQELLKVEVENYGRRKVIRRRVRVTPGYGCKRQDVREALLEAVSRVPRVLKTPQPYVRITGFLDYAVEYTLYAFIKDVKSMREIDAELYEAVLESCKRHGIDISTPLLHQEVQG